MIIFHLPYLLKRLHFRPFCENTFGQQMHIEIRPPQFITTCKYHIPSNTGFY